MAGELAEAFEAHLRSLSDSEWAALTARVRTPAAPPPATPWPGERVDAPPAAPKTAIEAALQEARKRGYLDADGKPKR
jgi:hypothetical protein